MQPPVHDTRVWRVACVALSARPTARAGHPASASMPSAAWHPYPSSWPPYGVPTGSPQWAGGRAPFFLLSPLSQASTARSAACEVHRATTQRDTHGAAGGKRRPHKNTPPPHHPSRPGRRTWNSERCSSSAGRTVCAQSATAVRDIPPVAVVQFLHHGRLSVSQRLRAAPQSSKLNA